MIKPEEAYDEKQLIEFRDKYAVDGFQVSGFGCQEKELPSPDT